MKRLVVSGMARIFALLTIAVLINLLTRVGTEVADVAALCLWAIGVVVVFSPAPPHGRHAGLP